MDCVVEVSEGKLRGCEKTNYDGELIVAFLGIPYAKPPVGELRFKAPQPPEPWQGIKDATKVGNKCVQIDIESVSHSVSGSEDCLNLNVYTKEIPQGTSLLKPVMVWIHGGAFVLGSNDPKSFGPAFLMTKDIVLVVINYRLGFLGFLSLDDPSLDVPGNAALKDQALALKWVQKNIKHFGGDPNNVTIFGESAGGTSVHYHVLSPHSKGLFHKAICQSGDALIPFCLGEERHAVEFVKSMGKTANTEKEALEILRTLSGEEIVLKQAIYSYVSLFSYPRPILKTKRDPP
ncbi:hypothetical protein JTB14_015720 [Gonioctena quinquepunctata]|nr:hypothetical protein JTB14_015720 [Gonioctena quinquepunctata]